MIAPFLKVPWRGDVERLREVNRHPPCESCKLCMKMRKKIQNERIFYLSILRLLIRGPNGVNRVNRVNHVCKPCEPPNFACKLPTSAITKDNSKQSIRIK
jgi:hypothetical protein